MSDNIGSHRHIPPPTYQEFLAQNSRPHNTDSSVVAWCLSSADHAYTIFNPEKAQVRCSDELKSDLNNNSELINSYVSLFDLFSRSEQLSKCIRKNYTIVLDTTNDFIIRSNDTQYAIKKILLTNMVTLNQSEKKIYATVFRNGVITAVMMLDIDNKIVFTLLGHGNTFKLIPQTYQQTMYCGVSYYDGTFYEGGFFYRRLQGRGKIIYDNGNIYEGLFEFGKPHGYGSMKYHSGEIYIGNWINGRFNGYGSMKYNGGETYRGNWINGRFNGYGIMDYPDGIEYNGEWENCVRNGKGKLSFPGGETYDGSWEKHVMQSSGKLTYNKANSRIEIDCDNWDRGCLPIDRIPKSNLKLYLTEECIQNIINSARGEFNELMKRAPVEPRQDQHSISEKVYPKLAGKKFAYTAAIDPYKFKHDGERREYGPNMFSPSDLDPCNASNSYLIGFFACTESLDSIPTAQLTLRHLKDALSKAFPEDYIKLNINPRLEEGVLSAVKNPILPALLYYDLANTDFSMAKAMENGLFYPQDTVLPHSRCSYIDFYYISPFFETEEKISQAFEEYKKLFLTNVINADENKNQIKAAIILFISQIECSHFFNNGNNRISCQIFLNKLLVEYKVYEDELGSILFIPNGFSHYALSHLNYYLQDNKKMLHDCTAEDLETAMSFAIEWVNFGHECYQKVVTEG